MELTFGEMLDRVRACKLSDDELLASIDCIQQDGDALTRDEIVWRCEAYVLARDENAP